MRVETRLGILAILFLIVSCVFWLVVADATAGEQSSRPHLTKPTVEPTVLNHPRGWMRCWCSTVLPSGEPMCLGQHLRNYHGQPNDRLDAIGYRNWIAYHKKLHATGVYKAPKRSGCPGGICPAPRRRVGKPLQYRLFRRWRRK